MLVDAGPGAAITRAPHRGRLAVLCTGKEHDNSRKLHATMAYAERYHRRGGPPRKKPADSRQQRNGRPGGARPEQSGKNKLSPRRAGQAQHTAERGGPGLFRARRPSVCPSVKPSSVRLSSVKPSWPRARYCARALRRSRGHLDPGQVHHPIGKSKQRRAVRNHYHRAPAGQSGDGVEHVSLGLAVKVGGGLVEEQEARVAEEGARTATRCRSPAEIPEPRSPRRVPTP